MIERSAEPDRLPRANGIVGDAVRLLDERGLYRELAGQDRSLRGTLHRLGTGNLGRHPRPARSFSYGGFRLPLHRVRAESPVFVLPVPQRTLELVLERRAVEHGVVVRRRCELRSFAQDDSGVTVEASTPAGVERYSASYLVGCDGAHSMVRKSAGIDLLGATLDSAVSRIAHVTIPRGELTPFGALRSPDGPALKPFHPHRLARGVFTFGSFGTGLTTVSTLEWGARAPDDDVPLTIDEMCQSVGRVVGRPVDLRAPHGPGPHQLRRTGGRNARVAATFRAGSVFLAGDAAHVFTGYGAPSLNAGLLDAADLARRLGAAVQGTAGDEVLDGYDTVRRGQALRTVEHSAVQEGLLAPGDEVTARRDEFAARLEDRKFLAALADELAGRWTD